MQVQHSHILPSSWENDIKEGHGARMARTDKDGAFIKRPFERPEYDSVPVHVGDGNVYRGDVYAERRDGGNGEDQEYGVKEEERRDRDREEGSVVREGDVDMEEGGRGGRFVRGAGYSRFGGHAESRGYGSHESRVYHHAFHHVDSDVNHHLYEGEYIRGVGGDAGEKGRGGVLAKRASVVKQLRDVSSRCVMVLCM